MSVGQARLAVAEAAGNELNLITPERYTATQWDLDRAGEDRRLGWADLGFGSYNPDDEHLPIVWRYSPERLVHATAHLPIADMIAYERALRRLMLSEAFVLIDANVHTPEDQRLIVPPDLRDQALAVTDRNFPGNTIRDTLNTV